MALLQLENSKVKAKEGSKEKLLLKKGKAHIESTPKKARVANGRDDGDDDDQKARKSQN